MGLYFCFLEKGNGPISCCVIYLGVLTPLTRCPYCWWEYWVLVLGVCTGWQCSSLCVWYGWSFEPYGYGPCGKYTETKLFSMVLCQNYRVGSGEIKRNISMYVYTSKYNHFVTGYLLLKRILTVKCSTCTNIDRHIYI